MAKREIRHGQKFVKSRLKVVKNKALGILEGDDYD